MKYLLTITECFIHVFLAVSDALTVKFLLEAEKGFTGTDKESAISAIDCSLKCLLSHDCCASSYQQDNSECTLVPVNEVGIQKVDRSGSVAMVAQTVKTSASVKDCNDLLSMQVSFRYPSGVYTIHPVPNVSFQVYCDMETDGGGWTVFQRRIDGTTDFYRQWTEYEEGFGDLSKEFWLGNRKINQMTSIASYKLRVDLEDSAGVKSYAQYSSFSVGDTLSNYQLSVSGYSGNAGDSLDYPGARCQNGMPFTTFDRDNDNFPGNCVVNFKGAWWHNSCHRSNLNGKYTEIDGSGICWWTLKDNYESLKFSKMMIKR